MPEYKVRINGLDSFESHSLETALGNIDDVKIIYPLKKDYTELKAIFTEFIIKFGVSVASGLVASVIYGFLKSAKSRTEKPIKIIIENIEIIQGDKIEEIQIKIEQIINLSK